MSKLFVLVPGFGSPNAEHKLEILRSNLSKIRSHSWTVCHIVICAYDQTVFPDLVEYDPNITVVRGPGIVGQFIKKHAPPSKVGSYDYCMLLLDDVELIDNWSWQQILYLKNTFHLNIVSPSLTATSKYEYSYMLESQNSTKLKITSACEMFCYVMDTMSYQVYYNFITDENPWLWGIDLVVHKHIGFTIGLLNKITMHHHYKGTCYDKFPDVQPYERFLNFLKQFNETPTTLAALPAVNYWITEVAPAIHESGSSMSKAWCLADMRKGERGYLTLLEKIIYTGERKEGRNGHTISTFGEHLEFNFNDGFPLLTTKRVFWKGIVEELLWFLKGHTDAKELQEKGVHIWDGNSSREFLDQNGLTEYADGICGPIYGYQWRCFNGEYPSHTNGIDQLKVVIEELQKDFSSRRAVMSGWNPVQLHKMCLPPCHVLYQFTRSNEGLCCHMYQRSADTFLGVPFNIASTALLTLIIATALHIKPHKIRISFGDAHIYETHLDVVKQQLQRAPYDPPTVQIANSPPENATSDEIIQWIESLTSSNIGLLNYACHSGLKADMIA